MLHYATSKLLDIDPACRTLCRTVHPVMQINEVLIVTTPLCPKSLKEHHFNVGYIRTEHMTQEVPHPFIFLLSSRCPRLNGDLAGLSHLLFFQAWGTADQLPPVSCM